MIACLNSEIYAFLIKDCDTKIFSLFIFIKIIISCLFRCVNILFFNIKERIHRLIKVKFNTSTTSIKLWLFFINVLFASFIVLFVLWTFARFFIMFEISVFIINNLRSEFVFIWFEIVARRFDSHKFIILRSRKCHLFINVFRKLIFRFFLLIVIFLNNRIVIIARFI